MLRFFFRRGFLFFASLILSVGGPFLWFNDQWRSKAVNRVQSFLHAARSTAGADNTGGNSWRTALSVGKTESESPTATALLSDRLLVGVPVGDLREVIRFDVSPSWVTSRWGRVTTTHTESGLTGMRVPLVTGTKAEDLAGSLTYYFSKEQQVQRVTFDGYTGNPDPLTMLAAQAFHLRPKPTSDGRLLLASWNGRPTSVLRIRQTAVVRAEATNARFEINMEINRPAHEYKLSRRMYSQIAHEL